jgi:deazaflavin-dependent oxidoreductase (nitroreductase family)
MTMRLRHSMADLGLKVMSRTHHAVLRLSGGRVLHSAFGMPVVELRTIGRKTGRTRSTMLTTPVHDEDRVVLVASKGGDDRDPEWYRNLTLTPDIDVVINGETRRLRARTASADEKAALWPMIVASYKGYGRYQGRTERDIPVVICENRRS